MARAGQARAAAATSRQLSAAVTRRALLDAAAELIAERGPAAASVTAITERSRVSRGLVGWHFGAKDQLVVEVVERSMSEIESALRRSVSTGPGPSFAALSAAFQAAASSVSGRVLVTTLAHVLGHRDNITAAYARGVRRLVEVAAGAAASSGIVEPEATLVAAAFVSSMLGYGLQRALDPELGARAGAVIGQAFDHCGTAP
jgi:TetR/AcrR family acrAB operon transcriptional repressor